MLAIGGGFEHQLQLHFIKVGHKELRSAQIDANALSVEVIQFPPKRLEALYILRVDANGAGDGVIINLIRAPTVLIDFRDFLDGRFQLVDFHSLAAAFLPIGFTHVARMSEEFYIGGPISTD